ncbi:RNA-binding S4 domain-containing protein [Ostreibacterium oceani]|uniref:Heat shock protein 15 n=1 Tax=Ostreibacterium oceani TaxID=2654998 RepID=A0A6N7EWR0_9GAMM|nr:S4 domain-containing protein [Ostreibacterium oceani]MPV86952.1 hypothetical protein [Ostreibacterium oceani]
MNPTRNKQQKDTDEPEIRLDKWLWAARFYKTRSLATDAIKGGKVHVNGQRVKPSKLVAVGQCITINKAPERMTIEVIALSDRRQNYTIAQTRYEETAESIAQRAKESELRKLANHAVTPAKYDGKGRPTKKNRRKLTQLTDTDDDAASS